jgi:hypothetical protein
MLEEVLNFGRRLSALLAALALFAGSPAVCAGWLPTAEARMACCVEGRACPMHEGNDHGSGSGHVMTQAEADTCCMASEREPSTPSNPALPAAISVSVLGPGTVLPAMVPALVLSDHWRTALPVPTTLVPKHVLLSVFLV